MEAGSSLADLPWRWENAGCGSTAVSTALLRAGHGGVLAGGHVYLLGGRHRDDFLGDMLRFDVDTREWEKLPGALPKPSAYFTATVVHKQIWVVGGSSCNEVINDVRVFDIGTQKWMKPNIRGNPELLMRAAHAAVVHPVKPGYLLIFGGTTRNHEKYRNDLVELRCDVRNAELQLVAPQQGESTVPRAYHTMSTIGHRCFIMGGKHSVRGKDRLCAGGSMMAVYDARRNKWEAANLGSGEVPCPRSSHTSVPIGDEVIIFGGAGQSEERGNSAISRLSDMFSFSHVLGTIEWRKWSVGSGAVSSGSGQPCGRAAHSMVALGKSLIMMSGYAGKGTYPADVWVCECGVDDALPSRRLSTGALSPLPPPSPARAANKASTPPPGYATVTQQRRGNKRGGVAVPGPCQDSHGPEMGWQRKRTKGVSGSPRAASRTNRTAGAAPRTLRPIIDLTDDHVEDPDGLGEAAGREAGAPCSDCQKRLQEVKHLQEQLKLRVEEENAIRADKVKLHTQIQQLEGRLLEAERAEQGARQEAKVEQEQSKARVAHLEAEFTRLEDQARQGALAADAAGAEAGAVKERNTELEVELRNAHSIVEELRTEKGTLQAELLEVVGQRDAERDVLRRERVANQELKCEQERLARRVQEQNHTVSEAQHALKETARKARENNQAKQRAEEMCNDLQNELRLRDERIKRLENDWREELEGKMRELNNLSISREAAESRAKTRENEAAQLREECDKQRLKLTNQLNIIQQFKMQLDNIHTCTNSAYDRMQMLLRGADML